MILQSIYSKMSFDLRRINIKVCMFRANHALDMTSLGPRNILDTLDMSYFEPKGHQTYTPKALNFLEIMTKLLLKSMKMCISAPPLHGLF